jgi:broad specificity phosphatase PhoE
MSSIDIYLCQHGRTPLNVAGRLRGLLDPELDLVGQAESRDLAELLAKLSPTRVVSSPLKRAQQTASAIATEAGLSVELDGRFIDRSYGTFDGAVATDVVATYGRVGAAPGVEPASEVADRAIAALVELAEGSQSGPLVVVSHDAVIRNLFAALAPDYTPSELVPQRTGCWNLLRYTDGAWTLIEVGSKDDPIETALAR